MKMTALNALMNMDPEKALPLIKKLLSSKDEASAPLREQALFILAQYDDEEAEEILIDVLRNDPDPEIQARAVFWLGQTESDEALEVIVEIALNSDDDSTTSFTSWGPCDDGRLKPIVSGPGCQVGDDMAVTSTSSSSGYTTACGTSMASPAVAGVVALLVEQHRLSNPGKPDPDNATLKAILANSAADVEAVGPDYKTGYGSVRGVDAAQTIRQRRFLTGEVGQGEVVSFLVSIPAPVPEFKITLAWDDPAGTPNTNPALVKIRIEACNRILCVERIDRHKQIPLHSQKFPSVTQPKAVIPSREHRF